MARHDAIRDLGVVDLEEQTLLAHVCVSLFSHFVAPVASLHRFLHLLLDLLWRQLAACSLGAVAAHRPSWSGAFSPGCVRGRPPGSCAVSGTACIHRSPGPESVYGLDPTMGC